MRCRGSRQVKSIRFLEAMSICGHRRISRRKELIKQAIEKFPEREELKHKLLEIYYSAKNTTQFKRLAGEVATGRTGKGETGDLGGRRANMGKELDPGNGSPRRQVRQVSVSMPWMMISMTWGLNLNSELLGNADVSSAKEAASHSVDGISEMDLDDLGELDGMDSESLESSLSLDSEFLNNLEADQKPDAGLKEDFWFAGYRSG